MARIRVSRRGGWESEMTKFQGAIQKDSRLGAPQRARYLHLSILGSGTFTATPSRLEALRSCTYDLVQRGSGQWVTVFWARLPSKVFRKDVPRRNGVRYN